MLTTGVVSYPIVNDRFSRNLSHCASIKEWKVVVNVFEHFNNFPLLLAGRVLGGVPCLKLWKTEVIDFHLSLFDDVTPEVSTSLLFSAFESGCLVYPYFSSSYVKVFVSFWKHWPSRTWMVSEHRRRGFPEGWLADTFGAPLGYENFCILRFRNLSISRYFNLFNLR